jgi:hypothetical protein
MASPRRASHPKLPGSLATCTVSFDSVVAFGLVAQPASASASASASTS